MPGRRRGRPLKFGRPARLLALTLPEDVIRGLRRVHPDVGWAIVTLYDGRAGRSDHARATAQPVVQLAQLSSRWALIVVDPRVVRDVPGVLVVPVTPDRALLAFDEGRGLADLELAIQERLRDPRIRGAIRDGLEALRRSIRGWRRSRSLRFSRRSILLVEQPGPGVRRGWAGRSP